MKIICTTLAALFISLNALAQSNEMIKDLNPSSFSNDFSNYDQKTAIHLAQLSELSYEKQNDIEKIYQFIKKTYPNENINYGFIEDTGGSNNTQALIWGNKEFIVVAFRGTEPSVLWDLLTDGKFWNYQNFPSDNDNLANMQPGHGGFRKSLSRLITIKGLFTEIENVMHKCNPNLDVHKYPIYLTGHSLGAALSQDFIEPLNYKGYNWQGAYHFAPPLAVSCAVNESMRAKYGSRTYDIVDYKDYVPRAGRFGVAHFGKFYRICDDGLIYKETEVYMKFKFSEYRSELHLHSLDTHLKAIIQKNNSAIDIANRSVGQYPCLQFKGSVNNCEPN